MTVDPERLRIAIYPDPSLREKADPVDPTDPIVAAVARRMIDLMHEADGVGLAGPQVGLPWRLFVTNARDADLEDRAFINPHLSTGPGGMTSAEEGCLSLPGINVQVRRPEHAEITAIDLKGEKITMSADDIVGRIWQHEFDHLNGVLIIDKMSPMDRLATRKILKELKAAAAIHDAR